MSDEAFDRLADELFQTSVERFPVLGTALGLHEYDGLLSGNSRTFYEETLALTQEIRKRFEKLDADDLSGSRRLDRDIALYTLDMSAFQLGEMRSWESRPDGAEDLGESLFPLFAREFAPFPARLESMTARLTAGPAYLDEIESRLSRPIKLWIEMAIEAADRLPAFLGVIDAQAEKEATADGKNAFRAARSESEDAVKAYRSWLDEEILPHAEEDYRLGEEKFARLVEIRGLGRTPAEIRALGVQYLEEGKRELGEVAAVIDAKATVDEVSERIHADHPPDFETVLEEVRKVNEEARTFIRDHRVATLPPSERLLVEETPIFLRPILPFAAYMSPPRFEKVQEGVYIVTPPSNGEDLLKEHNYSSIRNTAVHEGYPGHHLQLSAANLHPSIVRVLAGGTGTAEMVEGWAHYCEDLMREVGFMDAPEIRFVQLQDIIWRALRIIIDVDLHSGAMSFDEAVQVLVKEAGMAEVSATAEVKRYTQYPTYQLSYLLGKHLIKGLREEVETRMGEKFSRAFFHDAIIYAGSIPFFLLRRAVEDKLAKLEEDVEDLY
ncbi:MAG: DUF885 domain-containing protein [Thermoplasmata archaeon]